MFPTDPKKEKIHCNFLKHLGACFLQIIVGISEPVTSRINTQAFD